MHAPEWQQSENKVSIIHLKNHDLLINNSQREIPGIEVEELKQKVVSNDGAFGEDIFKGWIRIDNPKSKTLFVDNTQKPKYFAKRKRVSSSHPGFSFGKTFDRDNVDDDNHKTAVFSFNSVLSEFKYSPEISQIVSSQEVQDIFKELGIEEIHFIEPLAAIIDRQRQEKYIFYPFVEAANWKEELKPYRENGHKAREAVNKLKEVFESNGFGCEDLSLGQMLIDNDSKRLYLIDTEGYYKKKF